MLISNIIAVLTVLLCWKNNRNGTIEYEFEIFNSIINESIK